MASQRLGWRDNGLGSIVEYRTGHFKGQIWVAVARRTAYGRSRKEDQQKMLGLKRDADAGLVATWLNTIWADLESREKRSEEFDEKSCLWVTLLKRYAEVASAPQSMYRERARRHIESTIARLSDCRRR